MRRALLAAGALALVAGCTTDNRIPPRVDAGPRPDGASVLDCTNGVRDGDEAGPDCGGPCEPCAAGSFCRTGDDCESGVCLRSFCLMPSCDDGVRNGLETGRDCGGDCGLCPGGEPCTESAECVSGRCVEGACVPADCMDGRRNAGETDVDCGGPSCPACASDRGCVLDEDCESGLCVRNTCSRPACNDRVQNQDETSVDCGGATCPPCRDGLGCAMDRDCEGGRCFDGGCVSCEDRILNAEETDVDCGGGLCAACADGRGCAEGADCESGICLDGACISCTDLVRNGDETDVDCGGGTCPACTTGRVCSVDADCASVICRGGTCNAAGCGDGVLNNDETDLDCGGPACDPCGVGGDCLLGRDCDSGVCGDMGPTADTCLAPACDDGVANGDETDVDCGGLTGCPRCADFQACGDPSDCETGMCTRGRCGDTGCIPFPGGATDSFGYFGCTIPLDPAMLPCPDISSTGTPLGHSDDTHDTVPIGFDFDFYGSSYSTVGVVSNGALTFPGSYLTFSNACLPRTSAPTELIAAYWDDLDPGEGTGEVYYETRGAAPNRRFIARWDTQHFPSSPSHVVVTAVLEEGTNHIRVCYHDTDFGSATYDAGASATTGLNGSAASLQFSCNTTEVPSGLLIEYRHP